MVVPALLVLLRATVVVNGEDGAADERRCRTQIDRRLAAVCPDLQNRTVGQSRAGLVEQLSSLIGGHETGHILGGLSEGGGHDESGGHGIDPDVGDGFHAIPYASREAREPSRPKPINLIQGTG